MESFLGFLLLLNLLAVEMLGSDVIVNQRCQDDFTCIYGILAIPIASIILPDTFFLCHGDGGFDVALGAGQ